MSSRPAHHVIASREAACPRTSRARRSLPRLSPFPQGRDCFTPKERGFAMTSGLVVTAPLCISSRPARRVIARAVFARSDLYLGAARARLRRAPTTRPYNTPLQHAPTTRPYNALLQRAPTTCPYITPLQRAPTTRPDHAPNPNGAFDAPKCTLPAGHIRNKPGLQSIEIVT
ncbi:hypothetical protein LSAC_00127 [Levilinea saccharolytica]|nr:hypothetical protein LSAC_00127 [Levilinea saccharolytica]